jgi:diguanylate cyclase (GGDEF)-like protein
VSILKRFRGRTEDELRAGGMVVSAADRANIALQLVTGFEAHGLGWFWQTDRQGKLTYLSDTVRRTIEAATGEPVIGATLVSLFQMDGDDPATERTLAFHMTSRTVFTDYSVRPIASSDRRWSMSGRPCFDAFGKFEGFVGSGSDLTQRLHAEEEIKRLALYDALTGLANRQRMRLAIDQTLAQSIRSYRATSLLLLDLDRFKAVNDTLGHQTGDALLVQVAQRVTRAVGEMGLVGRLGGDEFQVLLPDEGNREALADLARTIIASLSQPYFISGSSISIGCSIGIAVAPNDGEDSETLTRSADLALYAAKADGRGMHHFYREEMLSDARSRRQMEDDLRVALVENQLYLVYQAIVATSDHRIIGYEALLRWRHPTRGDISPVDFIPVAEESGLIEAIGEWVLRTATREAATWPGEVRVAVNVSPIQFVDAAFPATVTSALAASGIAPGRLELEITESVFLTDSDTSDTMFRRLKALGVRLSLDDFGTGYSSLGYLRHAPFDKIKIDKSFVRGSAMAGNRNPAIIKAIVALAETLGMETTAEGVEVRDEIDVIRALGCGQIQGHVYGLPLRRDEVAQQLRENGGVAVAEGFRISRAPRMRMLRWARMEIGGHVGDVRIRNLSTSGAMVDGVELAKEAVGTPVSLEVMTDATMAGEIRWADEGQAGVAFATPFDMRRLNAQTNPPRGRRTG